MLPVIAFLLAALAPIPDDVYRQEVGAQVKTDAAINAVAIHENTVYCGMDTGLRILGGDNTLRPVPEAPAGPVLRLESVGGALYLFTDAALHALRGGAWAKLADGRYYDVCEFNGWAVAASETQLFAVRDGALVNIPGAEAPVKMRAIAPYADTLYCMGLDRLMIFDGSSIEFTRAVDFGGPPSKDLRDLLPRGNQLIVGTYFGLGILRGAAMTKVLGTDGLPHEECLALAPGFGDDYWIATPHGAIRATGGEYHVFSGPRWLPDNHVHAIACSSDTAYIATSGGLGIVRYVPMTLEQKAAIYEQHLADWRQKRMAFTHELHWDEANQRWLREVSDNDLGWSTHYWAAQAFKYAATKDPKAREEMIAGFNALKWSEEITSVPGYPARSIWAVGETGIKAMHGSGDYDAEWHPAADPRFEWKGDTSSDETDAQLYYAAVFHDLIDDDALKAKAKEHAARIVGHIVANGYRLIDVDGEPTVWGRWDPEYFNSWRGAYARGLNGLGILSYLSTAIALTGEDRFTAARADLIAKGYPAYTVHQKLTTPTAFINHSDDRLAFYNYYQLLRYEKEPALLSFYRRSIERSWEIERIEHNPWFNFIYGAVTGNECEAAQAVAHLRAWPLDLVNHPWDATTRDDLFAPPGYLPYADGSRAISPRERGPLRWSDNGMELKGGSGRTVRDPSGWLDAYWMGRHHGFIAAPTEAPPVFAPPAAPINIPPYDGPPMPDVLRAPIKP